MGLILQNQCVRRDIHLRVLIVITRIYNVLRRGFLVVEIIWVISTPIGKIQRVLFQLFTIKVMRRKLLGRQNKILNQKFYRGEISVHELPEQTILWHVPMKSSDPVSKNCLGTSFWDHYPFDQYTEGPTWANWRNCGSHKNIGFLSVYGSCKCKQNIILTFPL